MFTVDSLLEMAVEADAASLAVTGFDRMDERRRSEQALLCAEWMQANGLTEVEAIGPFGHKDLKRGQKVRIKAGAVIRCFCNEIPACGKAVVRPYTVTVHSADQGWVGHDHHIRGRIDVRNQQVHWAGTGGYWRWTDATNVEVIE